METQAKKTKTEFMIYIELMGYSYMAKQLGVSRQVVRSWAIGSMPTPNMVRRLVKEFELTYQDFYEAEER